MSSKKKGRKKKEEREATEESGSNSGPDNDEEKRGEEVEERSMRPSRSAAIMAQAISEAQQQYEATDPLLLYPPYEGARRRLTKRLVEAMPALQEMHVISLERVRETGAREGGVGAGCREEQLSGGRLAEDLAALLAGMRADYMQLLQRMQGREYGAALRSQLAVELERRNLLRNKQQQLTEEIDELVEDGLALLKLGLKDLEIEANSPAEFIRAAKTIVSDHNELKRRNRTLRQEIRRLEAEQQLLAREKEEQLVRQLLNDSCREEEEVRRMVQRQISACLNPEPEPVVRLREDVSLTRMSTVDRNHNLRDLRPIKRKRLPDCGAEIMPAAASNLPQNEPTPAKAPGAHQTASLLSPGARNGAESNGFQSLPTASNSSLHLQHAEPQQQQQKRAPGISRMCRIIEESVRQDIRETAEGNAPSPQVTPLAPGQSRWTTKIATTSPELRPSSRPTSTGSKRSLNTPEVFLETEVSRKRSHSPVLETWHSTPNNHSMRPAGEDMTAWNRGNEERPPRAGSRDAAAAWGGDRRGGEDKRRWQDEISSGFDRLVALASEVDRRKYSGEVVETGDFARIQPTSVILPPATPRQDQLWGGQQQPAQPSSYTESWRRERSCPFPDEEYLSAYEKQPGRLPPDVQHHVIPGHQVDFQSAYHRVLPQNSGRVAVKKVAAEWEATATGYEPDQRRAAYFTTDSRHRDTEHCVISNHGQYNLAGRLVRPGEETGATTMPPYNCFQDNGGREAWPAGSHQFSNRELWVEKVLGDRQNYAVREQAGSVVEYRPQPHAAVESERTQAGSGQKYAAPSSTETLLGQVAGSRKQMLFEEGWNAAAGTDYFSGQRQYDEGGSERAPNCCPSDGGWRPGGMGGTAAAEVTNSIGQNYGKDDAVVSQKTGDGGKEYHQTGDVAVVADPRHCVRQGLGHEGRIEAVELGRCGSGLQDGRVVDNVYLKGRAALQYQHGQQYSSGAPHQEGLWTCQARDGGSGHKGGSGGRHSSQGSVQQAGRGSVLHKERVDAFAQGEAGTQLMSLGASDHHGPKPASESRGYTDRQSEGQKIESLPPESRESFNQQLNNYSQETVTGKIADPDNSTTDVSSFSTTEVRGQWVQQKESGPERAVDSGGPGLLQTACFTATLEVQARPQVPGENLPERHFKKKYFNQEFQKQQAYLAANF